MDQPSTSKKRKLEASKCQISFECNHCKGYVPSEKIWRQSNGTEAQFECKICNVSVQLIVKPLIPQDNSDDVVRGFQENFAFEEDKPEIKIEPADTSISPPLEPSNPVDTEEDQNSSAGQPESLPDENMNALVRDLKSQVEESKKALETKQAEKEALEAQLKAVNEDKSTAETSTPTIQGDSSDDQPTETELKSAKTQSAERDFLQLLTTFCQIKSLGHNTVTFKGKQMIVSGPDIAQAQLIANQLSSGADKLATLNGKQVLISIQATPAAVTKSPEKPVETKTLPRTATAQLIQTPHGPRIVLNGLQGVNLTPEQLSNVQQRVKEELLKTQAEAKKAGTVPPTKIQIDLPQTTTKPEIDKVRTYRKRKNKAR